MTMQVKEQSVPIAARDRLHFLDIVRGFAMLGIIMVNYFIIATSSSLMTDSSESFTQLLVQWFAEGKFYTLFSFLFGIGFIIFMNRAETRFDAPRIIFMRRLVVLFGFGLLHITLIWSGDILTYYAVTGLLLLAFYKCRPRTLLIWSAILMVLSSLLPLSWILQPQSVSGTELFADNGANSSYLASIGARFAEAGSFISTAPTMIIPMLMMFLLGMYFVKQGLFHQMETKKKLWYRIWIVCACCFLFVETSTIISTLNGSGMAMQSFGITTMINQLGGVIGSLFYMSSLAMLFLHVSRLRPLLMLMGNVGRMSLTCYLLHSTIGTWLFFDYGLGLGKLVQPVGVAAIGFGVFLFLITFSSLWLKRFKYGPVEWIWRKLTYGKMTNAKNERTTRSQAV
ncbi:DUF418 domain-containing protein [Paenibacillus campi]|uniref:DUF418 domain-containing protein n=1 Tax=Paenibacillus campi TaxID=3106031 RepID=UPI002AFF3134|nr:DUF418 domain-containing protein [Paenibacillus sp. SGZ-1014]